MAEDPLRPAHPLAVPVVADLSEAACLELLAARDVGRVVYTVAALPAVTPVVYTVGDGVILARSADHRLGRAAAQDTVVAFQVDDIDGGAGSGWSVVVVGVATRLVPPDEPSLPAHRHPAARTPARAVRDIRLRISLGIVTGHRFLDSTLPPAARRRRRRVSR